MPVLIYVRFALDLLRLVPFCLVVFLHSFGRLFIPHTPKSLKGEIILVTGGANGIGKEICLELVHKETNLTIIIWDIDETRIQSVVSELEILGVKKAVGFKVDISDRLAVKNAARKIQTEIGDVTMLFNNAGISGEIKSGWTMKPEIIEKVFGVNMLSHCWTFQEFLPAMIRKGKGHIIEMCSILGIVYGESGSPYTATKHAIRAYTEVVKEDLRKLVTRPQINFTIVYPHHTLTAMMAQLNLTTKYPFMDTIYTAQQVAERLIQGVLVNEEHVYFPWSFRFVPFILAVLPTPVFRRFMDMLEMKYDRSA